MTGFDDLLALSYWSPWLFAREVLGVDLRPWQSRTALAIQDRLEAGERHHRLHIRTCHSAGKTFFSAVLFLWWITTRPQSRILTTAPTWHGVNSLLWPEIRALWKASILGQIGFGRILEGRPRMEIEDKWFGYGISSDKPEHLEGGHSPTAAARIIDEAKAVSRSVRRATQGLLHAPESLDMQISTPWEKSGPFYESDAADDPGLLRVVVTLDELEADGLEGCDQIREEYLREFGGEDSPEYRARALAEYIHSDELGVVHLAALDAAMGKPPATEGPVVVGVDVARSADRNESVIAVARGDDLVRLVPLKIRDLVKVARMAVQVAREHDAEEIRIDALGLGAGPVDIIRDEGFGGEVVEFVTTARPGQRSRFRDRGTEAAWNLVDRINSGDVSLPADEGLRAQALQVRFRAERGGKIGLDKSPGGRTQAQLRSPDRWDAAVIALAPDGYSAGLGLLGALRDRRIELDLAREKAQAEAA